MINAESNKEEMISVHALGKFEFCHRAGLIAHESEAPDREESRTPRLDHLPDFEIARITEARKAVTDQLIRMGLFLGVVATGIALASQYIPGQLFLLILLAIALPVRYSYLLARDYWELTQRIWRHDDAAPAAPARETGRDRQADLAALTAARRDHRRPRRRLQPPRRAGLRPPCRPTPDPPLRPRPRRARPKPDLHRRDLPRRGHRRPVTQPFEGHGCRGPTRQPVMMCAASESRCHP
jgi:hypothetical protein